MTTPEIILIITTTGTALIGVISEIRSGWGRKLVQDHAEVASVKLDEIHEMTNGNLSRVTAELAQQRAISTQALERIDRLEQLLRESIAGKTA